MLAITLALASPSLAALVNQHRLSTQTNHMLSSLMLARSEAIKRNARVVLCKSSNGVACVTTGHWE